MEYKMPLSVGEDFILNSKSVIDIGKKIELVYLYKENQIKDILGYCVLNDLIYVEFEIDEDTYNGYLNGDITRDFIDANLEYVIIDGERSYDWVWV